MAVSWNAGISNRWTLDDYQRLPPQNFPINVNSVHVVRVENETFVVAAGTDAGHSYWVVYDVDNERIAYPRREFPTGMVCCSVVDGQAMTFTVGGGEMRAWDMMSGSQLGETLSIEAQGRTIEQAELAKVEDELTLLFTTHDELWAVSAGTGKTIARRYVGTFPRLTIGMVHGQALVAVGNTNGRVRAWSLADWAIVATIEVGFPVSDVMLTDSGVLVCGDPGILSIWLRPRKGACSRGASGGKSTNSAAMSICSARRS